MSTHGPGSQGEGELDFDQVFEDDGPHGHAHVPPPPPPPTHTTGPRTNTGVSIHSAGGLSSTLRSSQGAEGASHDSQIDVDRLEFNVATSLTLNEDLTPTQGRLRKTPLPADPRGGGKSDAAINGAANSDAPRDPGFSPRSRRVPCTQDFDLLCVIGMGAFGRVLQVRNKLDQNVYAMKVISKRLLRKKNSVENMRAERDILTRVDHPFVVTLKCSFSTETKLYLVMEYMHGGELFFHLRKQGLLLEDTAKFYVAEIVLALEHLHEMGIIHRDLKPENVLVAGDGHTCLTDFGLAFYRSGESGEDETTRTMCGTTEYMAPEMILRKGYNKAVDFWSLGALMYEMMVGKAPFRGKTTKDIEEKILKEKVKYPGFFRPETVNIMKSLLERNVSKRLGATKSTMFEVGGMAALKQHKFFKQMNWRKVLAKQVKPPLKIEVSGADDTSNFDTEFTGMRIPGSISEPSSPSHSQVAGSPDWNGFSWVANSFEWGGGLDDGAPLRHMEAEQEGEEEEGDLDQHPPPLVVSTPQAPPLDPDAHQPHDAASSATGDSEMKEKKLSTTSTTQPGEIAGRTSPAPAGGLSKLLQDDGTATCSETTSVSQRSDDEPPVQQPASTGLDNGKTSGLSQALGREEGKSRAIPLENTTIRSNDVDGGNADPHPPPVTPTPVSMSPASSVIIDAFRSRPATSITKTTTAASASSSTTTGSTGSTARTTGNSHSTALRTTAPGKGGVVSGIPDVLVNRSKAKAIAAQASSSETSWSARVKNGAGATPQGTDSAKNGTTVEGAGRGRQAPDQSPRGQGESKGLRAAAPSWRPNPNAAVFVPSPPPGNKP